MGFALLVGMLIGVAIGFRAGRSFDKPVLPHDVLCEPFLSDVRVSTGRGIASFN